MEIVRFNTDDVTIHLAAAGAGKTTAAMKEITEALQTYRPDEIAFVTYTRKGVENGIERALKVNPDLTPDDLVHFKTLHALCFRESGLARKNIMTPSDLAAFNQAFGFHLSTSDAFGHCSDDDKLLQRYDSMRAGSDRGIFVNGAFDTVRYERLVNAYEAFKQGHDLVDFYDCLLRFMAVGEPLEGVKVAIIDEAQDLTPIQWKVCVKAFSGAERIRVMGDDFQSLYTYSGASPETLVEMASHYNVVKHETSYRIPGAVYKFTKGITALLTEKVDKDYKPATDKEGFVKFDVDRQVLARIIRDDLKKNGYKAERWYCLFRTNCFIEDFSSLLEQFIVPYTTAQGFCVSARDIAKIKRYYAYRQKGYGTEESKKKFMAEYHIEDINDDFIYSDLIPGKNRYFIQDLVNAYGIEEIEKMSKAPPFCLLSTVHKVKGGEADYTAMFMDSTKLVDQNCLLNMNEELRVLYVGCTRCKEGLYMVPAKGKFSLERIINIVRAIND